ncbi:UBC core domain-containing protein [Madurella fahalii]|uniref:UBC core domain-containing protein n=1 Tax=Madurella fahalii TaxID=1157608 RepID=A0ABQ0G666_9PEZI
MSFRKFKSDVATAAQKVAGGAVPGIVSVANGDSDGEVVIKYHHDSLPAAVRIQALAQHVAEYPDGNIFMLWTADDDEPPQPVVAAVKAAQDYLLGMSVYEMITELASRLEKEFARMNGEDETATDADVDVDEDDDDYDAAYDSDYLSNGEEFGLSVLAERPAQEKPGLSAQQEMLLSRVRRDLRQVKQAGYKVGFLDSFGRTANSGLVSISIRADKLALSDEAMEAWDVKLDEYIVLLLRFERAYDPLERILEQAAAHTAVTFRIGKCNRYKPSITQALGAFAKSHRPIPGPNTESAGTYSGSGADTFEKLFISNSLDGFLNESFLSLLKLRETRRLSWEEANELFLTKIGFLAEEQPDTDVLEGASPDSEPPVPGLTAEQHQVLGPDHLLDRGPASERSFPLIAMQFAMRYFVKCTEYCLRCHRRLEKGFEALRPYVCSDPLCLFQYMAMGFGPSIEHEILTEPYVVDLLVSMCYAAVQPYYVNHTLGSNSAATKLPIRTLPVGLRLQVPNLSDVTFTPIKAKVIGNMRLLFDDEGARHLSASLAPAKWVAFRKPQQALTYHARILEVSQASKSAVVEVMGESSVRWGTGQLIFTAPAAVQAPAQGGKEDCDVFPYDTDFDSLEDTDKGTIMRHILDTLPPILDIEEWLTAHPHHSFRSMNRISPAAASLLQWIVSSNRSCIFQVDRSRIVTRHLFEDGNNHRLASQLAGRGRNREHERIPGMDGWVQFRFAQGSPDKELRFNRALKEVAEKVSLGAHPTIFAWHGSNMANWHSIVRTGLDYQDTRNGRAYGNGVYFSPHFDTSTGYSSGGQCWPNSDLLISTCLSLNEIINAPEQFVSKNPHYVVSQLDWHQCRYLFVKASAGWGRLSLDQPTSVATNNPDQEWYPQAPGAEVRGPSGQPLQIPVSAIPLRTISVEADKGPSSSKRTIQGLEDSDNDDGEDVSILFTDDEFNVSRSPPVKKPASRASSIDGEIAREKGAAGPPTPASIDKSLTDFEPGALDLSSLPRLEPPTSSTGVASKALSREFHNLHSIQAKTALHELGWYMDFGQITNLFQWIVEFHSFGLSLPLAQDMKRAGVTSVVVEMRFPADFPFNPPFVRVIRPRFLPFAMGGGGHVTAGGAMCMELLTSSGWSPANSMESVFLQVRMAMCNLEPMPARLDPSVRKDGPRIDYGIGEAIEAFTRAARAHGWAIPADLQRTANGV